MKEDEENEKKFLASKPELAKVIENMKKPKK